MTSRLLDVEGAAEYLSVTPRFIRRLVAERRLPFVKLGRHLRFDTADLDRFIDAGRVDAGRRATFPLDEPHLAAMRRGPGVTPT